MASSVVELLLVARDKASSTLAKAKGGMLAFTAAIAAGVLVVRDLINTYNESAIVTAKLRAGLQNVGDASKETEKALMDQATAMSRLTGINDEEIVNAQALLTTFQLQGAQIQTLIPGILDMSASLAKASNGSIDLQSATLAIGKAVSGEIGILSRYGVVIDENTKANFRNMTQQERLAAVTKAMSENFEGQAEAVGATFAGRLGALNSLWGDMKEIGGELIAGFLRPVVEILINAITWFKGLPSPVQRGAAAVALLGGALAVLVPAFMAILPAIMAVSAPIWGTVAAVVALGATAFAFKDSWTEIWEVVKSTVMGPIEIIQTALKGLGAVMWALNKNDFKGAIKLSKTAFEDLGQKITEVGYGMKADQESAWSSITGTVKGSVMEIQGAMSELSAFHVADTRATGDAVNVIKQEQATTEQLIEAAKNEAMFSEEQRLAQLRSQLLTAKGDERIAIAKKIADAELALESKGAQARASALATWEQHIIANKDAMGKKGMALVKAIQIKQTLMDTYSAAVGAYKALAGIPIVGPVLGGIAAGAATAFGLARVNQIRSMEEGGIVPGTAGGTLIRAGEGGKSEAIVPLENSDSGGRMGTTIIVEKVFGTMDLDVIRMIDAGLAERARRGESSFANRIAQGA